jgi:hypothetical protein
MIPPFLLTPIGKYLIIAIAAAIVGGGLYLKVRSGGASDVIIKGTQDILKRTQDAIRAGNSVDTSDGGLRKPDSYNRD